MKILHFIYAVDMGGGAEKYLNHLLPGLQQRGVHCHLVISCPPQAYDVLSAFANELNTLGIRTLVIIAKRISFVSAAKKLADYCKENDISVVHSHLINSDIIASLAKKWFNKNIFLISTKHGYDEKVLQVYTPGEKMRVRDLYFFVTKFTLSVIDRNIAVSKGIADLYRNLGLTKQTFPALYHGISIPLEYMQEESSEQFRRGAQQLIIVGRIEQFKGHQFLIEALAEVVKFFPNVVLLVLGEGNHMESIRSQVEELNLSENVQFLGFQKLPYAYIAHSDVIVLPSLFEPFGLVYLEAFALKTPVVAFDTPAGNEIMENGKTAHMVPKADARQLAEKIIMLLKNKDERCRLAATAYNTYKQKFTVVHMVENTLQWYKTEIPAKYLG